MYNLTWDPDLDEYAERLKGKSVLLAEATTAKINELAEIGNPGVAAAAFYAAAYAAMNVGIFAVITLVAGYDEELTLIDDYRGLLYRSPLLGSLLIFFLISLTGVPFTGGFFGNGGGALFFLRGLERA